MARVTPLMAQSQNQHIRRSKGLTESPDFALLTGLTDLGATFLFLARQSRSQDQNK